MTIRDAEQYIFEDYGVEVSFSWEWDTDKCRLRLLIEPLGFFIDREELEVSPVRNMIGVIAKKQVRHSGRMYEAD